MGVSVCSIGASFFIFAAGGKTYETGFAGKHHTRTGDGAAGDPGARLHGAGGRRDTGAVPDGAGGLGGRGGQGLRRQAADAVLRRYAPARAAVSHAGHGNGSAAAGLAGYIHVSHRGAVRRSGLCAAGVPAACRRPYHQRHHAGVYVFLFAHGRHAGAHGGAGKGGRYRLCGQGEHGQKRAAGGAAGDDGGIRPGDAAMAGGLPVRAREAHNHAAIHPQLHRRADDGAGAYRAGEGAVRAVTSVGEHPRRRAWWWYTARIPT